MFDLERDIYGGHFNYVFSRLTDDITNEGWQDHATPEIVCNMLLEKYEYKQTDKILVLFNAELINALHKKNNDEIIYSNIYYIADTEKKYNYIKKYLPKINCKYLEEKNWSVDKLMETIKEFNMPKHFDVLFSNPPYNRNLDLKLIKSLIDNNIADKIIAVHPGAFLFGHNNEDAEDLKNSKMLKNVILFWGNEMFNTNLRHVHCISVWDKNYNNSNVIVTDKAFTERKEIYNNDTFTYTTNVKEMTIHSLLSEKAWEMYKKFEKCENIFDHQTNYWTGKKTKYGVKLPSMRNGLDYTTMDRNYGEFFSFFGCTEVGFNNIIIDEKYVWDGKQKLDLILWYFDTEEERQNFIKYLKTKTARFILSLLKNVKNLPQYVKNVPWMDFTKTWTDEKLVKEFGIDEELWKYIDKFIPDYYEDYKTTARGNI